jgi:hypothetical protein
MRRLIKVLTAIELNNDRSLQANKVTDVDTQRVLPSEFETSQLAAS